MSKAASFHADSLSLNLSKGEMALWSGAAAFVLAAHLTGAWYLQRVQPVEAPSLDAAPAIMMELAPMAVAPEAVLNEMAEMVDSAPAEQVEEVEEVDPVEEPVLEEEVVEEEPVETEEIAEVEPLEEVDEVVEEIEEVPLPEVAMAVPQRRPVPEKPRPIEKPVEKKVEKKVVRKKSAPQIASTKSADDAPKAAAPRVTKAAAGSGMSPARWQSRVNAHLNRYKRYPSGARGVGIATVSFTINPGGDVIAVSLARSSGDPAFDTAAVELVRRASPVPAPPPDIAKSRMSLVVPIRYSR
jgi:protein TonB